MKSPTLGCAFAVALTASLSAADWPQWRGPRGTGATDEKNLPVTWNATENVAWRAPLGGVGVSSPIVSGDRVFVTSQIGTGVRRAGNHPRLAQGSGAAVKEVHDGDGAQQLAGLQRFDIRALIRR